MGRVAGDGVTHRFLVLRLEAPLMSFGSAAVDQINPTDPLPGRSMLTGLIANALGWDHAEHERLGRLQARLRFGARADRPGNELLDYHTVDLGQDFMLADRVGWTTWGRRDERKGGLDTKTGTHIRYRYYRAEAVVTVVLRLDPLDDDPSLDAVADALAEPARPLFLGRKTCLPASPIFRGFVEARDELDALVRRVPLQPSAGLADPVLTWVPPGGEGGDAHGVDAGSPLGRILQLHDERDWRNQVHLGTRAMRELHVPRDRFVSEAR